MSDARVVVIGGGAMGVSLLYHLAKRGWHDVVLLEKNELTAGSTWHAAGLCTHFAHNATIMALRATSVRLYRDLLPEETGASVGFHPSGALRITRSHERMAEFHHVRGLGQFVGHEFHILTPDELARIYPLAEMHDIVGAIHEPFDGHVDPSLATNALAAGARARGAQIRRHTAVRHVERSAAGDWVIHTDDERIRAQHVVNAAGTWCREVGAMMGVDLPVVPMLHQYIVTDRVPEIAARIDAAEPELPIIRDPEESWYLRQERDGFIVGPYEANGRPWSIDGVPPDFGMELLAPDLDSIEAIVTLAMARVPALTNAGIKTVVNGPITFTPDANPLIGPTFGLDNAWLLTGSSMGVMEGGGAGSFLADWIVDGSPPLDALAVDPRRFGAYADRAYRVDKAIEAFGLQFGVHYPHEERAAGRPRRMTPLHERQCATGAVFGCAYGWERPNWFARDATRRDVPLTFFRPDWIDAVAAECKTVRDAVGLVDLSAFAKFEVLGSGARDIMNTLGANRPPTRDGGVALIHALTAAGGVASEFTVTRLKSDHYYLTSAAAAERHDEDLLRRHACGRHEVQIVNCTERFGVLAVMGPNARTLLETLTDADLGDTAFPWLSACNVQLAAIDVRALRVSYVGELGWELHAAMADLPVLYEALLQAGERCGLRPFGSYAMNAMRLEKGYRAWGVDLSTERSPLEAGLGHLVRTHGRTFTGREALLQRDAPETAWRMALLALEADDDVQPFYAHTVWQDGRAAGVVTSGAVGHRTDQALCLAYLRPGVAAGDLTVAVLDRQIGACELASAPYDPDNARVRGAPAGPGRSNADRST